jgi:hypothetical protein
MHTEQAASVLPAIQIDEFSREDNVTLYYGFNVENAGVGPAFLHSATLLVDGKPVEGQEHLASVLPQAFGLKIETEPMAGRVIAPGVAKQAIEFAWRIDPLQDDGSNGPDVKRKINVATGTLGLEICYCSTLNKCWTSKSKQRTHAKEVASCPAPKEGLF